MKQNIEHHITDPPPIAVERRVPAQNVGRAFVCCVRFASCFELRTICNLHISDEKSARKFFGVVLFSVLFATADKEIQRQQLIILLNFCDSENRKVVYTWSWMTAIRVRILLTNILSAIILSGLR